MNTKKTSKALVILLLFITLTYLFFYQKWLYSINFIQSEQTRTILLEDKTDFLSFPFVTDVIYNQKNYVNKLSEDEKLDYYLAFLLLFNNELSNNAEGYLVFMQSIEGYEEKISNRVIELRDSDYYSYFYWQIVGFDKLEKELRYIAMNNKLRYKENNQ